VRLRITFAKTGTLRYTGHLDLQTVLERTARRAALPLAYTQGFHPGPRIQIACALPLGFSGRAELVDLWLDDSALPSLPPDLLPRLQSAAPPGLTLLSVEQVEERSPALQTRVVAACYQVTLLDAPPPDLADRVTRLLEAPALPRQRRAKPYDLRPLILSLEYAPPLLHMTLSAREGATGRPEELLDELGLLPASTRIERTHLVMKDD
jgi:radical SAM-linked protein